MTAPIATLIGAFVGALVTLVISRAVYKREVLSSKKQSLSGTWGALMEVRFAADDLWTKATPANLDTLVAKIRAADSEIQRASIVLEEDSVHELRLALSIVTKFRWGRASLIDYRSSWRLGLFGEAAERICSGVVEENGAALEAFKRKLQSLESDFRDRLLKEA